MFTGFLETVGLKKKKAVKIKGFTSLGIDGFFFKRLDDAYLNSPTATMALLKFHEYCVPSNLKPEYVAMWNKIKSDYIRYGYFILNVKYTIDGTVDDFVYKNPKHFLPKAKDDNENVSTFLNIKTNTVYPSFNSDPVIVKSQFTKDGYKKYLGQIYMYNDSSLPFRITPLFSVINWMDVEANSSTYASKACDNAMFGNNIFVMKKSSDASAKELEVIDSVKNILSEVKGAENAAQNLLIEYNGDIEDVTKLITKLSISNEVDMDLLNGIDSKAEDKICMACYGFPKILVSQSEGIFGNSGEAIRIATEEWAKTCQREADKILEAFNEIGILITKEPDASIIDTNIPAA